MGDEGEHRTFPLLIGVLTVCSNLLDGKFLMHDKTTSCGLKGYEMIIYGINGVYLGRLVFF